MLSEFCIFCGFQFGATISRCQQCGFKKEQTEEYMQREIYL
jgi:hypothetical protein